MFKETASIEQSIVTIINADYFPCLVFNLRMIII